MQASMTVYAAAKRLQSSRSHIYLLLAQKRLQSSEVGGKILVTQDSVERYIQLKEKLETIQKEMRKSYYAHG